MYAVVSLGLGLSGRYFNRLARFRNTSSSPRDMVSSETLFR